METSYIADFNSFHHEFCTVRDEVLQSLASQYLSDRLSAMSSKDGLAGMFLHSDHTQPVDLSNNQNDVGKRVQLDTDSTPSRLASVQSPRREKNLAFTKSGIQDGSRIQSHCNRTVARPRKGHKKSRRGCFSCKQRKIKCPENQPACTNCIRVSLDCVYPAPKTLSALQEISTYAPNPVNSLNLQCTPTVFSPLDMRLFHHFLQDAYPHLPVGNEDAWKSQVPLIAHHNQYLMHAILGMAASHIQLLTGIQLTTPALQHRMLAINGSNEAISRTIKTGSEGDALLATCYLLAFQSSYMTDGFLDCIRLLRGCSLLNFQLRSQNLPMAFFLSRTCHFEVMKLRLTDLPAIDSAIIDSAERSLQALVPLIVEPAHSRAYQSLLEITETLRFSSLKSYFKYLMFFQSIIRMPASCFEAFIAPTNHAACILLMHFLAIEMIMEPIQEREFGSRARIMPTHFHLDWIPVAYDAFPEGMRKYLEWPREVAVRMGGKYAGLGGRG